jgi:hypothetical protein
MKKTGKDPHIIGVRLQNGVSIASTNYILVISKNLDFVFNCPVTIQDYRGAAGVTLNFPITGVEKVTFRWPDFVAEDPLKPRESEILNLIKQSGNLVFIHPDSYTAQV